MPLLSIILKIIAFIVFATSLLFIKATPLSTYAPLSTASVISTAISLSAESVIPQRHDPLKGEDRGRINVLFLGMPGLGNDAPYLTDTILLASLRPDAQQLGILSLPRDLLVTIPPYKTTTKINALFRMHDRDPALIEKKVEEITGEPVDYYIALDLDAVEQIVDALGGLNVLVPEDINDIAFPTPDHGTEIFSVQKGWRYFDGKTVQRYLRTRHSEGGDFARMRQQQAVLEAIRKKVFGLHLLYNLPTIFSVARAIAPHIQTDINDTAIQRFYDIAKSISYDKVISRVVDGDPSDKTSLLKSSSATLGGKQAFVLVPKAGQFNYSEIRKLTSDLFSETNHE